jgi:hypothetical protein
VNLVAVIDGTRIAVSLALQQQWVLLFSALYCLWLWNAYTFQFLLIQLFNKKLLLSFPNIIVIMKVKR